MSEDVCEVVITAPDAEWLADFTRRLVDDRLAAAGHVTAETRSIYRWEGQVYDKPEARLVLHTRRSLVSELVARTNAEHPYVVPCVAATPIVDGGPEYVAWILAETKRPD